MYKPLINNMVLTVALKGQIAILAVISECKSYNYKNTFGAFGNSFVICEFDYLDLNLKQHKFYSYQ